MTPKLANFKNLAIHSPKDIKENLRKNYRSQLHHRRTVLFNVGRQINDAEELKFSLKNIWREIIPEFDVLPDNVELYQILQDIENEVYEEELIKLTEEYENMASHSLPLFEDNNLICPLCQRNNVVSQNNTISCDICSYVLTNTKSLEELRKYIDELLDQHSSNCSQQPQFAMLPELNEKHMYLVCDSCSEMFLVL